MTSRRIPPWFIRLSMGGLVGVMCIAAVEVGARLLYRPPWYDRLAKAQLESEAHLYRFNRDNLRDRNYPTPKPAGHLRVLVLGDSFTFGLGVYDDQATFPEILERKLNGQALSPGGPVVEILNAGMPASLTGDWVDLLPTVGSRFDPDVVLVVFFLRDGTRTASIPEFFGQIRDDIVIRNHGSLLYELSYTYRIIRDYRDMQLISGKYTRNFTESYFGNESETSEWRAAQENILRIRDYARARAASVGLVIFPVLIDLNDRYPFTAVCDLIEDFAKTNGIPVYSLLPAFRGQSAPDLWVSSVDQHPNAKAHAIAAEALEPFVLQLLGQRGDLR